MGILRQGTFEPTKTNGENDCKKIYLKDFFQRCESVFFLGLKKSLPEDYKKVGIPTYKSVTDEFEIYKTAVASESGKFNISEIYTSDGLTMVSPLFKSHFLYFQSFFLFLDCEKG